MRRTFACIPVLLLVVLSCNHDSEPSRNGNMALVGGSATVRRPLPVRADDPTTTNDESNDQPRGYFGSISLSVTNESSGNTYTLDADIDDHSLQRIYFPRGGWVDFPDCQLDNDLSGDCEDEKGRSWKINGEG